MTPSHETLTIETPEKIRFNYKISNIGLRIAAYIIDIIIQDIVFALIALILGLTIISGTLWDGFDVFNDFDEKIQLIIGAIGVLVFFLLRWGYFLFWETFLNGQTIGKKICRIRVIRADGSRLDFSSIFLRNFLRCVDALPLSDMFGGLMMVLTKQNKRIGDLAAGTLVVMDKNSNIAEPSFDTKLTNKDNSISRPLLFIPTHKRLDEKNLYILRDIINNRGTLPQDSAIKLGKTIVQKIEQRIDISPIKNLNNFEIIEEVYKAHNFHDALEPTSLINEIQDTKLVTKSESFANKRKDRWRETIDLMNKIRKKRTSKLTPDEAERFPFLYRQLTQDLAEAGTLRLSPDILNYLNALTGEAHHLFYFYKPISGSNLKRFITKTFPRGIIVNFRYVLVAAILFWGTGLAIFFYTKHDPANAAKVVPAVVLEQMDTMYQESPVGRNNLSERFFMGVYYINNNISIGFLSFATGVLLGIGSICLLLYNGVFLGAIFGYLSKSPANFEHLITFVTAHSFLELTGIVICGAAGLRLGVALIQSWHNHSILGIEKHKEDILTLLSIGTVMIFLAAFVESGVSPSSIPYPVKISIAAISALGFILLFIIYPLLSEYKKRSDKARRRDRF